MYMLKKFSIVFTTILLIAILAACGQSTTPTASPPTSSTTEKPATTENKTITYKAANGEVQVPSHPQRVAVLADSYYGYLYALGIKPIATIDYVFQSNILKETTKGVTDLGDNPDVEKVLALNPDLIVVWDNDKNIEKYQQIAPTVAIKYGQYTYQELLQEFGKMTGTEDKAKEVAAAWETKINEVKPKVQAAIGDKTVSILQPYAKGIYAMGDTYGRGGEIIYQALGLKATPMLQKEAIDSGAGFASLSLENLPDFAGDYIFTSPWGGDDDKDGSTVYNSSLWKDLPAVKTNHVYRIDPIAYYFNDPISMNAQLDYIVKSLTQS